MQSYKKKYHAEWWSSDIRPKGTFKRSIEGSVREEAKQEIRDELKAIDITLDTSYDGSKED